MILFICPSKGLEKLTEMTAYTSEPLTPNPQCLASSPNGKDVLSKENPHLLSSNPILDLHSHSYKKRTCFFEYASSFTFFDLVISWYPPTSVLLLNFHIWFLFQIFPIELM